MALTLSFDDFDSIRRLIYQFSGIALADSKVVFMQIRVADRLRALNIESPREYYHFLKYDPAGGDELQQLVDLVAINETWFFRETEPFVAWLATLAPDLLKRQARARVWCAGCSTGEEAYTVAMLIAEAYPATALAHYEIVGTDISTRALSAARAASYDQHSLRHTAARWIAGYLQPVSSDASRANGLKWLVAERIRRLAQFEQVNLLDALGPRRLGPVDVVLCRNVIIYFDQASRQTVLANLYAALRPGGHLILGRAESLAQSNSPFELVRVSGSLMYRKPG